MVNTAHTHGYVKSSPKRGFSLGVNSSPCIPRKKSKQADGHEDDEMCLNVLLPPLPVAVGKDQDECAYEKNDLLQYDGDLDDLRDLDDLLAHDPAEGSFVGGEGCDDDWLKLMSSAVVDDGLLAQNDCAALEEDVSEYHHFRSFVNSKQINIKYIDTKDQIADALTKPLGTNLFFNCRKMLCGW